MYHLKLVNQESANSWILVDDADKHYLEECTWSNAVGYAKRYKEVNIYGKRVRWVEYLHRLIMEAKEGEIVDHINQSKHDNRRCNLRIVNKSINAVNTDKRLGVTYHKQSKKWYARLCHKSLGLFENKQDAINAYQKAKGDMLNVQ